MSTGHVSVGAKTYNKTIPLTLMRFIFFSYNCNACKFNFFFTILHYYMYYGTQTLVFLMEIAGTDWGGHALSEWRFRWVGSIQGSFLRRRTQWNLLILPIS